MKIETEIEKCKKRAALLTSQNARFKKLLEAAMEVTNAPERDENDFWQDTIKLIEDEKLHLQEDLDSLTPPEDEASATLKKLEKENAELQNKVDALSKLVTLQGNETKKLKAELAEIKFLLSQPDSNAEWFKSILNLDDNLKTDSNTELLEKRDRLQRRVMNLERKKTELFYAIEDITNPNPDNNRKATAARIKSDLEVALFKAIDQVAKRELDSLQLQVIDLEKERSDLLNQVQQLLDDSRRKIAEEYCCLQKKILEVEKQKLRMSKPHNVLLNASEEKINKVLDAFSTTQNIAPTKTEAKENLRVQKEYKLSTPACILL